MNEQKGEIRPISKFEKLFGLSDNRAKEIVDDLPDDQLINVLGTSEDRNLIANIFLKLQSKMSDPKIRKAIEEFIKSD